MSRMPLFLPQDMGLMIVFRPRNWFVLVRSVARFQRRLAIKQYPSIADVYSRGNVWFYAFLLMEWGVLVAS